MKGTKSHKTVDEDLQKLQQRIGTRLKKIRKRLGYTNSDTFAYDHGINRSQYGKYEAGSQDMRLSTLKKIINAMGLTVEQFFKDPLE